MAEAKAGNVPTTNQFKEERHTTTEKTSNKMKT